MCHIGSDQGFGVDGNELKIIKVCVLFDDLLLSILALWSVRVRDGSRHIELKVSGDDVEHVLIHVGVKLPVLWASIVPCLDKDTETLCNGNRKEVNRLRLDINTFDLDHLHVVTREVKVKRSETGHVDNTQTVRLTGFKGKSSILAEARQVRSSGSSVGRMSKVNETRFGDGFGTGRILAVHELVFDKIGVVAVIPIAKDDGEVIVVAVVLIGRVIRVDDDRSTKTVGVLIVVVGVDPESTHLLATLCWRSRRVERLVGKALTRWDGALRDSNGTIKVTSTVEEHAVGVERGSYARVEIVGGSDAKSIGSIDVDDGRRPCTIDADNVPWLETVWVDIGNPVDVPVLLNDGSVSEGKKRAKRRGKQCQCWQSRAATCRYHVGVYV